MSRYLITGGTGFIGRALAARLAAAHGPDRVLAVGRNFDLESAEGSDALFRSHGQFDHILHLADVQGNAEWSASHAADQLMRNTAITWNVLRCWRAFQPQARLVAFSSLWAYPEHVAVATEETYWAGRMHPATEHYGLGKKLLTVGIETHKRQFGMRGTTLVLGSVYGPGDSSTHVIPSLIRRISGATGPLAVLGNGRERRQFIFIDDQVEGILAHMHFDGDLLNVASESSHSIAEVVSTLAGLLRFSGEVVFDVRRPDSPARYLDSARARRLTGWPSAVRIPLEDGLSRTVSAAQAEIGRG